MDAKLKAKIEAVTAHRAKIVLAHIVKHGRITTEELKRLYGYSHPPRGAMDVKEQGIPLRMHREKGPDGRSMAVYTINESAALDGQKGGRKAFPKSLKKALLAHGQGRCALCGGRFEATALQIDHRVPFAIGGETDPAEPVDYMLVCGSCNRGKSWSCEHCPNWSDKAVATCKTCMWASPDAYDHVATESKRRLDIVWEGADVAFFDRLAKRGDVRELVKALVRQSLGGVPTK